jgi:DNA topoisomerase-1
MPPLTTSSLQQEAVKKLNFTTKKAMMVAQQLYEGVNVGGKAGTVGLITYMRTDSVHLAASALEEIRSYIKNEHGEKYLPSKPNVYSSKKNAQEAHEAIRPTSIKRTPASVAKYLTKDQLKLYGLIWHRTVASQMTNAHK